MHQDKQGRNWRAGAERLRSADMRTPPAPVFAALFAVALGAPAWSAARAASLPPAAGHGPSAAEESLAERRAVRGGGPDDTGESPELKELRRFEEQAFPRGGPPPEDDELGGPPPPDLPGHWEGTGDVPSQLRSPEIGAAPRAAPAPDSEWLRSLKLPDLPMRWDPQVLRYLDYFKNDPRGHAIMAGWLRRLGRYRALFETLLEREGVPKDLVFLCMIESGFETSAKSRVGAGGLWQFMPSAARAYGLEISYWVDARRDPERSAAAAARYLKDLYVRFGSWHLVFAAYNAGYGAVLKSIARYNTNDYWELIRHESGLPWESSIYVPKILAAAVVGHNLEAFGFGDVVFDPPFSYDWVEASPGAALPQLARLAGASVETLQALNPQLIRDRMPPDRADARLRVPAGAAAIYAENLRKAPPSADADVVVLRFGETLDDVAKARGCSARELRKLNGVKETAELRAGVAILVPRRKGASAPSAPGDRTTEATTDGASSTDTLAPSDEEEVLVAVPDRTFSYEGRDRVFYRLRDGDDLESIASTFHVRPDDLVEWNNLDPGARLQPKMVLQIFVAKDFDPTGVFLLDAAKIRVVTLGSEEFLELEAARRGKKRLVYQAKAGDTLAKVGRRYGLTPGDLARINRFSYNTELHDGQKIIVYSPIGSNGRELAQGLTPEPRRDTHRSESALAVPRAKGRQEPSALAALATKSVGAKATAADDKTPGRGSAAVTGKRSATEPPAFSPRSPTTSKDRAPVAASKAAVTRPGAKSANAEAASKTAIKGTKSEVAPRKATGNAASAARPRHP
jgi:membrane-bound lytic murein transglycosylase D